LSAIKNDGRKKRNAILAASLLLNIILASSTVYFVYQNSVLTSGISQLDRRVGELNEQLHSLGEKYDLAQYQLQYYRSWTEKYWNSTGYASTVSGFIGRSSINIVAVREVQVSVFESSYEGVVMTAEVEIRRGEDRLLINTQPKIGIDLQASGQTAEVVVQHITGVSFDNLDVILTIRGESEVDVVDGPSAGAAITICMMAALQNRPTDLNVFISGTVNPDGTIGKVGGLPYKALAAAKKGAVLFLVPPDQTNVTVLIPREENPIPGVTVVSYEQEQVNLQQLLLEQGYNVHVTEAKTIVDAYNQFVR
jgi:uncharacterized protein